MKVLQVRPRLVEFDFPSRSVASFHSHLLAETGSSTDAPSSRPSLDSYWGDPPLESLSRPLKYGALGTVRSLSCLGDY